MYKETNNYEVKSIYRWIRGKFTAELERNIGKQKKIATSTSFANIHGGPVSSKQTLHCGNSITRLDLEWILSSKWWNTEAIDVILHFETLKTKH